MISERLKRSLNIRALLVEGCPVDDEARDEGADCFHDIPGKSSVKRARHAE